MGVLSTTIQITTTSLTKLINSSLSSNIKQNQQYTNLPQFKETDLDFYTLQTTNSSNQLPTISVETIISKNSSYSNVTSISAIYNSNQMATSSPINTTTSESMISSLSTTLLMINTTITTITDSDMMTSIGVSVAPMIKLFLPFLKLFHQNRHFGLDSFNDHKYDDCSPSINE